MASAASLLGKTPYRGFHVGFPGSGKTGALVALLNAGFKLRVLDYTGNYQPLLVYANENALTTPGQLDIINLQDRITDDSRFTKPMGIPKAFTDGLRYLRDGWKYEENGKTVDLGLSSEWGLDTVVVIDELTTLAKAAVNRAMVSMNKTQENMTSKVWGAAVKDVINTLQILKSKNHHVIINAHKQMLGPKDFVMQGTKDNEDIAKMVNEELVENAENDMLPTRFYPVGPTKNSSMTIHGEFPIFLEFEKITKQGKELRIIKTEGSSLIDTKIPGKGLKAQYPIETGLADIFSAMGYVAPGFKD